MALVEYIAHLSLRDWAAVPEDLRRLGFISADAPDSSVIAEPLGRILGQISLGNLLPSAVLRVLILSHAVHLLSRSLTWPWSRRVLRAPCGSAM
jgi:hypothetical protein